MPSHSPGPSVLRSILHPPSPLVHIRCRRTRPAVRRLLSTPHLALINHTDTATAATALDQVVPAASLNLIQVPDPRALQHGKHPAQPNPTCQTHRNTMPVGAAVAQQIRWIGLARLLREPVCRASGEDARAEQAREAGAYVWAACAQSVFPRLVAREVHVRVPDLAGLVQAVVQPVGAVGCGGREDGVRGGEVVRGEVVRRVGFERGGVRVVPCAAIVGGVGRVFSDGRGGDGGDGGFVGKCAGRGLLLGTRAWALRDCGHGGLGEVGVEGC